jgi:hypothetical protein
MMNTRRSIDGGWCSTAALIVFAAMLAVCISPVCIAADIQNTQVIDLESWNSNRSIHINNTGGSALTDYQINVLLPDGINETSLRVVNVTSSTIVPHWCENVTGGNCYEVWFNATHIPADPWCNDTYAVYYGNDTVGSTSDYNATFTKSYNTNGLVLELHMDEGTGFSQTNDTSGIGNHGALNMNTTGDATSGWQGVDGGQWDNRSDVVFSTGDQLRFDGVNDFVVCMNDVSLNIAGAITIEAWIKPDSIGAYNLIVGKSTDKDYDFGITPGSPNELRLHTGDGTQEACTSDGANLVVDEWYHIAVVRTVTPNEAKFYCNGQFLNKVDLFRTPIGSTDNVFIGRRGGTSYPFDGSIDEVRIYNRALSGDELYRQYIRSKYAANAPTAVLGVEATGYIPEDPETLKNTTGNYWVNYTWTAGGSPGNVTNSYYVKMNGTWTNGTTTTFMNVSVGSGGWANITVFAFNSSSAGTLSAGSVSDEVQASAVPADTTPPVPTVLQNATGNYWVNYTWTAGNGVVTDGYNVSMNDTWYNTTESFLNSSVGADNWSNITVWAWNKTGSGNMSATGVSDEVQAPAAPADTTPPVPTVLQNATGNYWVNYTWTAGNGVVTDGYNVSMNDTWYNTTNTYLNVSVGPSGWANISVWAWNATGDGNMSATNVSDNVQALAAILQRINVTWTSLTLNINESVTFNATGYAHNDYLIDPSNITFAWYTTPSGIGKLNATTGSVVNFTALHAGRTEIYAVNGSVSSNATDSIWITVNALPETKGVTNGTGNATSGNSTATVKLTNTSVNGTITIKELGDPINGTEDIGNQTGLGNTKPIKGVNVTVNESIKVALNDTGSYVHIRIEYNGSQLGNIDENTLYIYKFVNGTGWVRLVQGSNYCIANGRNTTANHVWVNVTNCSILLLTGTPTATPTPSSGTGGGGGTYPPGWFGTPTPTVTATKAPAASTAATTAPPGERTTPAAKRPATGTTAPAAEGDAAKTAKEDAPGFTTVFVIAGLLAVAYAMMRRRE